MEAKNYLTVLIFELEVGRSERKLGYSWINEKET